MSFTPQHLYKVDLEVFEGPLDLLLHLIKKNDVDILDIPISHILAQYLQYLELMQELNIDLAGDFLLMASELAHIKSKMLLPQDQQVEEEEEGQDPRDELVRRLLEYQRYKEAAQNLQERPQLGRDTFVLEALGQEENEEEAPLEAELFTLMNCFLELLKKAPKKTVHEVTAERISVTERLYQLLEILKKKEVVAFAELFEGDKTRPQMIVSFLAILEMAKLKLIHVTQTSAQGELFIKASENDVSDGIAEQVSY